MTQGQSPFADYHWRIEFEGLPSVTTDELTLDEVEIVERVGGVPWVNINPRASLRVAKALLVVMAIRAGESEDAAFKRLSKLNLKQIKRAFIFVEGDMGDRPVDGQEAAGPPSLAPTSPAG